MAKITTEVLDTSSGRPASDMPIVLEIKGGEGAWQLIGKGTTDHEGHLSGLVPDDGALERGTYRLTFDTAAYFGAQRISCFYPEVQVLFTIREPEQSHHLPLMLSPFGYSTYSG